MTSCLPLDLSVKAFPFWWRRARRSDLNRVGQLLSTPMDSRDLNPKFLTSRTTVSWLLQISSTDQLEYANWLSIQKTHPACFLRYILGLIYSSAWRLSHWPASRWKSVAPGAQIIGQFCAQQQNLLNIPVRTDALFCQVVVMVARLIIRTE